MSEELKRLEAEREALRADFNEKLEALNKQIIELSKKYCVGQIVGGYHDGKKYKILEIGMMYDSPIYRGSLIKKNGEESDKIKRLWWL